MGKGVMGEARKATGRRMLRFVSFPYAFLGAALVGAGALVSGCLGGSDGVENPKLEFEFTPENGGAAAGRVSLYGKGMNPVEDGLPLLGKDFTSGTQVAFTPDEMDAALKQVLLRRGKDSSALGDTTVHFNLVAGASDKEAFVGGFSYRRSGKSAGFAFGTGSFGKVHRSIKLPKAVKGFSGRMGIFGITHGIDYIFVPGSPYHADIKQDSTFTIPQMSPGAYGIIGADTTTATTKLFQSSDTLNTSDSSYSAKAWDTIFFVPDGN
jgi:hypothetical protein